MIKRRDVSDYQPSEGLAEERRDRIMILSFNRPAARNAIDASTRSKLIDALERARTDTEIEAVVLTGAGDAFAAGQDLEELAQVQSTDDVRRWLDHQHEMYQAARNLTKPCVAALNGVAVGAGFQLALLCDHRCGAAEIRIGQPEIRAGLASIVGSYLISLYVGLGANQTLSLRAELMSGEEAFDIGLISSIVPRDEVLSHSIRIAKQMAALPQTAFRLSKERFRELTQADFDSACEAGVAAQIEAFAHGEAKVMISDFISRRRR